MMGEKTLSEQLGDMVDAASYSSVGNYPGRVTYRCSTPPWTEFNPELDRELAIAKLRKENDTLKAMLKESSSKCTRQVTTIMRLHDEVNELKAELAEIKAKPAAKPDESAEAVWRAMKVMR